MHRRHRLRRFILVVLFFASNGIRAQETTREFWPEIDTWLRLSNRWRLSLFLPLSTNLETKYREGNVIFQVDYAFGKTNFLFFRRLFDENRTGLLKPFLVRGGYLTARSLGDNGDAYNEKMLFSEFHFRVPLKGRLLMSHRLRTDFRWIGDDHEFSARIRYRLMVEKEIDIKKVSLVPYVNAEPYYDTRYSTVNRVRLIGGATVSWSTRVALEGNITYQHDSRSSVTNLYALNIILHLFFETNRAHDNVIEPSPVENEKKE